ncbi:MAG: hypothetical protein WC364_10630 [Eubacteriales bacterium]|jgi:hypothetical protein
MAAGKIAAPGTEYGPCKEPCSHTDCASSRSMAEAECIHCGKPIGYETSCYSTETGFAHAKCEELFQDVRRRIRY